MAEVMFCTPCGARWPGHERCPDCGALLTAQRELAHEARIEDLPQFHDLAEQFALGRKEVTPRRRRKGRRES